MSPRTLGRFFAAWGVFLFVLLIGLRTWMSLGPPPAPLVVETEWLHGKRVGRAVHAPGEPGIQAPDSVDLGREEIVGEGPLMTTSLAFDMGLVPGRDGVKATIGTKTAYATVDDLMSAQAYDRGHLWVEASFGWGTHKGLVLAILGEQLGISGQEVLAQAKLRRVRFERKDWRPSRTSVKPPADRPAHLEAKDLTRPLVLDALHEAAIHLARDVDASTGRFRYMIDAPTNQTLPGYNWPRHSGATFFLAQAAAITNDAYVRHMALRSAARLRDEMMRPCGKERCITEDQPMAEIGSSALALIAFTEIARTKADLSYTKEIAELASFLRSQQRPDGEFMHLYDRGQNHPVDVQYLYYSGEATLGLARAHAVLGNPADLEAAKRALSHISGSGWSFFGSRYYFSEEHWTCQAVSELWDRAPDRDALAFCSRWHEYQRRLQYGPDDSPFDADGAFGFGPLVSPRVTPASSRGEAAGALLDVLLRDGSGNADVTQLTRTEFERALAFVIRHQFHPGPAYLFADPVAVRGALPGSPVDWQLRIDYAQHAGCMMARWLEVDDLAHAPK